MCVRDYDAMPVEKKEKKSGTPRHITDVRYFCTPHTPPVQTAVVAQLLGHGPPWQEQGETFSRRPFGLPGVLPADQATWGTARLQAGFAPAQVSD